MRHSDGSPYARNRGHNLRTLENEPQLPDEGSRRAPTLALSRTGKGIRNAAPPPVLILHKATAGEDVDSSPLSTRAPSAAGTATAATMTALVPPPPEEKSVDCPGEA